MTRQAFLASDPDAWDLVKSWIEAISNKPAWRFDCDPEDVTHDVLVVLCDKLLVFRGESPLEHYVRAITFRICVNHHRAQKKRALMADIERVILAARAPGALESVIQEELAEIRLTALIAALESADSRCFDLWLMRYWERLPSEAIARVMGVAADTVKTRAWRCIRKARMALGLSADEGEPLAPVSD